jgi:N-acetylmuramoyl-L-alanine amidase
MKLWKTLAPRLGLFLFLAVSAQAAPLVWLDPGHGGSDRGVTAAGFVESRFSLDLAQRLAVLLTKQGIKTSLSRTDDSDPAQADRIQAANQSRADLAVSLHANCGFGRGSGPRVLVPAVRSEEDALTAGGVDLIPLGHLQSLRLAESRRLGDALAKTLKGARVAALPLAQFNGLGVPGVVVECGFASDEGDRARLTDPGQMDALAKNLAQGIKAYLAAERGL